MNATDGPDRGHRRLDALLSMLAEPTYEPPPHIEERVMRTARWQYTTRGLLRAATEVTSIVGQGLIWLASAPEQRRERK